MGEVHVAVAATALAEVRDDPEKLKILRKCADPKTGFREFLKYWWFLDQETGTPRTLGAVLWEGQEEVLNVLRDHDWVYELKGRKLGFTTLAIAEDAWVLRFRRPNERVHLFSRREDAAHELLSGVKYGLTRLPQWMKLPSSSWKSDEIVLIGGPDDERRAKAYPADEETAVEATCTHGHVDEWARMRNPRKVWQAIEPSMAGTCRIITTGLGPANYASTYWVQTMTGDTRFHPLFVDATKRQGRSREWVLKKRKEMPEQDARQEYPLEWKDSLFAGAEMPLAGEKLEVVGRTGNGLRDPEDGVTYIKSWDIGRHKDAAVGTVWAPLDDGLDLVHYRRLRRNTYPQIQTNIEEVHELYPGITVIEDNAAGEAVRENLDIPEREVEGFKTTGVSKPRMIKKLEVAIANTEIHWRKDEVPQLHTEHETYQIPDTNVVQDSVMSTAIAIDWYTKPKKRRGKIRRVFQI